MFTEEDVDALCTMDDFGGSYCWWRCPDTSITSGSWIDVAIATTLTCIVGTVLYIVWTRSDARQHEEERECVQAQDMTSTPVSSLATRQHETVAEDLQYTIRQEVREYLYRYIQQLDHQLSSTMMDEGSSPVPSTEPQSVSSSPSGGKRVLVTGGAGFVGSHLVDRLMMDGHSVIVVDNLFTGRKENLERWLSHRDFTFLLHDVIHPLYLEVDEIYHLACPASPPHYQYNPIKTIKTNVQGTLNMLGLAKRVGARILLTSTSEVYGDPTVHPQPESYWGNVNPIGPRACYDEGKRVAETMMYAYHHQEDVEIRVARIFNTFGPRMREDDGRVVSNFIVQGIHGEPLTIYGDGTNTRSFQYIDDLVDGLVRLMQHPSHTKPVNIGNPEEFTMYELAVMVKEMTRSTSPIIYMDAVTDDPTQRQPDITVAWETLGWKPKTKVRQGLQRTIDYFASRYDAHATTATTTRTMDDNDDEEE